MKPISYVIMLAATSAAGSYLFAAEPEPPATPAATATAPAPEPAEEKSKEAASKTPASEKTSEADKAAAGKGSPQRFIPSEQVRADFDVSFPIDI